MSGRRKGFTGPGSGAVSFLRHKAGTLVILIWVGQARVPARKCPSLRKQAPAGEPPPHHANTARGGDPGAGATRVWVTSASTCRANPACTKLHHYRFVYAAVLSAPQLWNFLSLSGELLKQLRQSFGVLGGFSKASPLVVLGEDQDVFPHLRIGNRRRELFRGLPRRFAQAFAGQSLQHPRVPEAGYRFGSMLRISTPPCPSQAQ